MARCPLMDLLLMTRVRQGTLLIIRRVIHVVLPNGFVAWISQDSDCTLTRLAQVRLSLWAVARCIDFSTSCKQRRTRGYPFQSSRKLPPCSLRNDCFRGPSLPCKLPRMYIILYTTILGHWAGLPVPWIQSAVPGELDKSKKFPLDRVLSITRTYEKDPMTWRP